MTDHDPIEGPTDEELARRARAGSVRSFEELARRYKRRLFVYLRPRVGSDEDAEDLVQDTFLKLYRNIGSYDPAFRFSTWLFTSAGRLAIDAYRKHAASRDKLAAESAAELPDPASDRDRDPRLSGLWTAAQGLGGDRFRVLWLRYGEDLSIEEIAAVLGRTKLAIRILLHRARISLMKAAGPSPARTIAPARAADARGARSG
jgi:RNA polymerase sigma-70 factor (ECF subfamily)